MRYSIIEIILLILAVAAGIVAPYLLEDRLVGIDFTLPTLSSSKAPAPEHHVSAESVIRFLRVLGVCFALAVAFCFVSSRRASRRAAVVASERSEVGGFCRSRMQSEIVRGDEVEC